MVCSLFSVTKLLRIEMAQGYGHCTAEIYRVHFPPCTTSTGAASLSCRNAQTLQLLSVGQNACSLPLEGFLGHTTKSHVNGPSTGDGLGGHAVTYTGLGHREAAGSTLAAAVQPCMSVSTATKSDSKWLGVLRNLIA